MRRNVVRSVVLLIFFLLVLFLEPLTNILSIFTINDKVEVQLEILESENQKLKNELNSIKEVYGLKENHDEVILAKVITRDIYNFYDEITIDKGSKDGIVKGSAVVSSLGLLGIVSKVYKSQSLVTLVSNKDLNISVKVNESYGNLNNFKVTNISNHSVISVGDKVYTSGLTDIYGNVYIGEVVSISTDKLQVEKTLEIKSEINYQQINYVGVLQ